MGLVQPTSGRILYNGQDVTPLSPSPTGRVWVSATAFQQPPRFKGGITVHDPLRLAAGRKSSQGPVLRLSDQAVGLCANDYLTGRWMCPRPVARSSALRSPPPGDRRGSLMIFDEPEASIDPWSLHG